MNFLKLIYTIIFVPILLWHALFCWRLLRVYSEPIAHGFSWDSHGFCTKIKKCIHFENTPGHIRTSCTPEFLPCPWTRLSEINGHFLKSWPWPLTYDLHLISWPRYTSTWPPCKNSSLYVILFGWYSETDRQTHTHCQNYYTHHVRDVGCKNPFRLRVGWPMVTCSSRSKKKKQKKTTKTLGISNEPHSCSKTRILWSPSTGTQHWCTVKSDTLNLVDISMSNCTSSWQLFLEMWYIELELKALSISLAGILRL